MSTPGGPEDVDMMDQADDSYHQQHQQEEEDVEGTVEDGQEASTDTAAAAAAPPKRKVSNRCLGGIALVSSKVNRRPKLTADRLLDDEHGLKCMMQDFEKSITFTGDTVRVLGRFFIRGYAECLLYPPPPFLHW